MSCLSPYILPFLGHGYYLFSEHTATWAFLAALSSCFLLSSHDTAHNLLTYQIHLYLPLVTHATSFLPSPTPPFLEIQTFSAQNLLPFPLLLLVLSRFLFRPALEPRFPCAAHPTCVLPVCPCQCHYTMSHPRTSTCFRLRTFNCAQNIYALEVKCYNCGKQYVRMCNNSRIAAVSPTRF
jgi:hypothetical protein